MNNKLLEFNKRLQNSKIAVIGVGVSNIPLLEYLFNLGVNVTIFSDNKIEEDVSKYGFMIYEGTDSLKNLVGYDIIL